MKVVLTGPIGSGKSTVVRAALDRLGWRQPAGFCTHWGDPGRTLYLATWRGEAHPVARPLAAAVDPERPPYELELELFNRIAVASLSSPGQPVVLDELGILELGAAEFTRALADVFRSPAPVLAVIQQRVLARWLDILGPGNVDELLVLDPATRAELPNRLATLFTTGGGTDLGRQD